MTNLYYPDTGSSVQSALPSPTSWEHASSSGGPTPPPSRRTSVGTSGPRQVGARSRTGSRTVTRPRRAAGLTVPHNCKQCGDASCPHLDKASKERANRRSQSSRLQDLEDIFQIFLKVNTDRMQSPGNQNAAGLDIAKAELMDWSVAYAYRKMEEDYKRALREGNVQQWQKQEFAAILDACNRGHPLAGTWLLEDPATDELCDHELHNKRCIVHGQPDWSKCRKDRRLKRFRVKQAHFRSRL